MPLVCSHLILRSSVIFYWNRCTTVWNLFVTFKIINNNNNNKKKKKKKKKNLSHKFIWLTTSAHMTLKQIDQINAEHLEKNLSEQIKGPTILAHKRTWFQQSCIGHIGACCLKSPLCQASFQIDVEVTGKLSKSLQLCQQNRTFVFAPYVNFYFFLEVSKRDKCSSITLL